jgi:midasin
VLLCIITQNEQSSFLFEWADGVVVMAMRAGGCLLVDEISLADDAVLERLNSILEPERKLVIGERSKCSGKEVFQISASDGFQFLATMNPGGDYGKKEVSVGVVVGVWPAGTLERG